MNSPFISRIFHEITINFSNSLCIYYLFGESTMNWLDVSRSYYKFTVFIVNKVRRHLMFTMNSVRVYTMNSLSITRIHSEFAYHIANLIWFHYEYAWCFANSTVFCDYKFTVVCCKFTVSNCGLFHIVNIILFNSRLESAIFLAHSLWIIDNLVNPQINIVSYQNS